MALGRAQPDRATGARPRSITSGLLRGLTGDRPVIAVGETKYHGDPVAAIAAETKDAAEEAARRVAVDFEELPAVFTVAGALAADALLVQDPSLRPNDPLANTNVLREHKIGW